MPLALWHNFLRSHNTLALLKPLSLNKKATGTEVVGDVGTFRTTPRHSLWQRQRTSTTGPSIHPAQGPPQSSSTERFLTFKGLLPHCHKSKPNIPAVTHFKEHLVILFFLLFLNDEIRQPNSFNSVSISKGWPSCAKNYSELGLSSVTRLAQVPNTCHPPARPSQSAAQQLKDKQASLSF